MNTLKNHLNKQKNNYIVITITIIFSFVMTKINTLDYQKNLADIHYKNIIKRIQFNHSLIQLAIEESPNLTIKQALQVMLKQSEKSLSTQYISKNTIADFVTIIANSEENDLKYIVAFKQLSQTLHSHIYRYNLEAISYNNYLEKYIFFTKFSKQTHKKNALIPIKDINDSNYFVLQLWK